MFKKLLFLLISTLSFAKELVLVAITHNSCPVCQEWHKDVAPVYPDEALKSHLPYLQEYDIANTENRQWVLSHVGPIQYLPTFAIMDGDKFIDKFVGYNSISEFYIELNNVLQNNDLLD